MVRGVLSRMRVRPREYADAEAAAMLGVTVALDRFDGSSGLKFETYARHWVRKAVLESHRYRQAITLPVWSIYKLSRETPEAYARRTAGYPVYEDDDRVILSIVDGRQQRHADAEAALVGLFQAAGLDERRVAVLRAYYGLAADAATFAEIGKQLGVTGERAKQLHNDAMAKIRSVLARNAKLRDDIVTEMGWAS